MSKPLFELDIRVSVSLREALATSDVSIVPAGVIAAIFASAAERAAGVGVALGPDTCDCPRCTARRAQEAAAKQAPPAPPAEG